MQITNIAGYKFIALAELSNLRVELLDICVELGCKGTLLLSSEGINISLSGTDTSIQLFKQHIRKDTRFADMTYRESFSTFQPFKHMKVKIKKEIITMHQPAVKPQEEQAAPHISPHELKQWMDDNRDFTLLDTRNGFEVEYGTFDKAVHYDLKDFGEFPNASEKLSHDKPIVLFCTGGIRCEKAGLYLLKEGFKDVYQLDGGILNYFSEVGGAHYHGKCFVFDQRVALDDTLQTTIIDQ